MTHEILRPHFPWITLVALIVIVGIANPAFFSVSGFVILMADVIPLLIMAIGMTFAIYIGGIDLSIQQLANMVTVMTTVYLAQFGISVALLVVLVGGLFGIISGFVTTRLYVPSFVSTLAIGFIALSIAKWLSDQRALFMDATLRDAHFGWMFGNTMGVPHELVIGLLLAFFAWLLQTRTSFGRALKAVGSGELAAVASGIDVDRVKILGIIYDSNNWPEKSGAAPLKPTVRMFTL